MTDRIILASGSAIRAELLRNAGLEFEVETARVDEAMIRDSMLHEGAPPRDIADKLAELKAERVARRHPDALVIGADQVLEHDRTLYSKPETPEEAKRQLATLSNSTHKLLSAAVIFEEARPVWRHVGRADLTMRQLSQGYIDDYVARNWESVRHSVGAYKLEEEGVRLFTRIGGDHFNVLGLPLLELLSYLVLRGTLRA
ncbi:Maf family protein [Pelagovum pacificum]|uniref:Nucleoside triphosphate pyrophosphatase n=1 Tax=Pelagovum pacificum TaxID=2588711 RepID=A0A5C5GKZ0_9RHOB|nr:Maf family nucleotide pyrophosphatase [Pelagovum pacificum]QQA42776.1 septum formation protein Maf [Pelagovum pacificum]TNY34076.1 septum formation protein Maf [Pelagovum pacificum]